MKKQKRDIYLCRRCLPNGKPADDCRKCGPASKPVYEPLPPRVPTTREVQRMASVVLEALGGPKGAADKLSVESFYALAYLAALNTDGKDGDRPFNE